MDSKTNNLPLIIGGVILLGGIAYGAYAYTQNSAGTTKEDMGMEKVAVMDKKMEEKGMEEKGTMMKDDGMMDKSGTEMGKEEEMTSNGTDGMEKKGETMTAGSYEAYSPEKLARAEAGDVVLFFHASWCPSCRGLNADIEKNMSAIPSDLTILKVDYDAETELKKKYGVTTQHTLVQVSADGTLIKKWSGGQALTNLVAQVQ